jgi:nicotinamidase-related amidase
VDLPSADGPVHILPMPGSDLSLDPRATALVLIDLQKGIVARLLTPHQPSEVLRNAHDLGRKIDDAGGLVVLVRVAFAPDGADRLKQPVDSPTMAPPGGFPPDWSEFATEIGDLRADVVITKRQWSAFHGTELDLQLRRRGITSIVLAGIATNFGVESTARDAWQHGYSVVIAEDACSSMGAGVHEFAIENILPRVSRVRTTAEILAAL